MLKGLFTLILFSSFSAQATGMMGASKQEIQIILSTFKDKEGASIKKIEKLTNGKYKLDLVTKKNKCHSNIIKVDLVKKKALFDKEVKSCG